MNHAILAVWDLPDDEKRMFDHYVFDKDDHVTAHLPAGTRGILEPLAQQSAGCLQAFFVSRA